MAVLLTRMRSLAKALLSGAVVAAWALRDRPFVPTWGVLAHLILVILAAIGSSEQPDNLRYDAVGVGFIQDSLPYVLI